MSAGDVHSSVSRVEVLLFISPNFLICQYSTNTWSQKQCTLVPLYPKWLWLPITYEGMVLWASITRFLLISPNSNAIAQLSMMLTSLIIFFTHFVFFYLSLWLKCSIQQVRPFVLLFDLPKAIPPDPDRAQRFFWTLLILLISTPLGVEAQALSTCDWFDCVCTMYVNDCRSLDEPFFT